jgi:hypothetical protein
MSEYNNTETGDTTVTPNESEQAVEKSNEPQKEKYNFDTAERAEATAEIKQRIITGLSDLYDILPHQGKLEIKNVEKLLENTRLRKELPLPFWRKVICTRISKENLNKKSKDEFLTEGVQALDLWIKLESGNMELTRQVEELLTAHGWKDQSTDPEELQRVRDQIQAMDSNKPADQKANNESKI